MSDKSTSSLPNGEVSASISPEDATKNLEAGLADRADEPAAVESLTRTEERTSKPFRNARSPIVNPHESHCFVVMPYGRNPSEVRWFRGWYDVVIEKAVASAGYIPILSATEERPNAINDEIRAHLAFDPMVVVDLGGATEETDPNPNVMYELGIRHALSLPLVMMAWQNQRLPFDVGNQRVIMETRELLDLETNRQRLATFIRAAAEGHFYRPMDAVGRAATLDLASNSLSQDNLLGVLVREVRDLRNRVAVPKPKQSKAPKKAKVKTKPSLKSAFRGRGHQKGLHSKFLKSGGTLAQWTELLNFTTSSAFTAKSKKWSDMQWESFIKEQAKQLNPISLRAPAVEGD